MIDLHTHTLLSDGALLPTELMVRAMATGYRALAITDHVDDSNLEEVVTKLLEVKASHGWDGFTLIAGVELTHIKPERIASLTERARGLGAGLVVCHGETLVEPVPAGTNLAAIEAGVDILAHPGLVTEQECRLAARKGVFFEVSGRKGHSLANGHVVKMARRFGVGLVFNTDAHAPSDLVTEEMATKILKGAGLTDEECEKVWQNARSLVERAR
ncbi:MAG TPA: histidinol phosphate phosphatase domain-containing protein [Deltaproteobacteria bacterium]|nr:histidinol phosphate phosphatase domain-containing protein [Deltaproteobacteria bacterium]